MPYLKRIRYTLPLTPVELQSAANWVITKMLNRIETLDKGKDILSYIIIAVKNFSIDEHRKKLTRSRKETALDNKFDLSMSDTSTTLEFIIEDISSSEQEEIILKKIVLEKKKPSIVAKELGINPKIMKMFLHNTKQKLVT